MLTPWTIPQGRLAAPGAVRVHRNWVGYDDMPVSGYPQPASIEDQVRAMPAVGARLRRRAEDTIPVHLQGIEVTVIAIDTEHGCFESRETFNRSAHGGRPESGPWLPLDFEPV